MILKQMAMRIYLQSVWGISSVGRALAWHARGHRFESGILHNNKTCNTLSIVGTGFFMFMNSKIRRDFLNNANHK
jgi:hypothetical protein